VNTTSRITQSSLRCRLLSFMAITGCGVLVPSSVWSARASADVPDIPAATSDLRDDRTNARIRGHGFVRDSGDHFATIDIPGARSFTVIFGSDDRGNTAGGYIDQQGKLQGFLRRSRQILTIDFPGAQGTIVTRVNAAGQIVGAYGNDANVAALELPHGFLLDHGVFTKIDVPGAVETRPFGINNVGQIVGEYVDQSRKSHGFLFDNGDFTTIDAPAGTLTWATDIDDTGRIVGISYGVASATTSVRGFLRDAQGAYTTIEAPAAPPPPGRPELPATQPFGINNLGQVTGIFIDSEGIHSFLLDNGAFTIIDDPDAVGSTLTLDVSDNGRIVGAYDVVGHGVLQDEHGNFMTIDHPDGVGETILTGINHRNQIVGDYLDVDGTLHSFLLDKGRFTTLEIPGALGSAAAQINARGQIVGAYSTITNGNHAFPVRGYLWERGVVTNIDFPGASHTNPSDINSQGQIVGEYLDAAGSIQSFLRDPDGTFTTIRVPGVMSSSVSGINDSGQMSGAYPDANGTIHGFLLDQGVVTNIDVPAATGGTLPLGINNRGQVIGVWLDASRRHGFMFSNGKFTTFKVPGAFLEAVPFGIDDRGRILGYYF
jgi:probable HAF family extracellular repeat protein